MKILYHASINQGVCSGQHLLMTRDWRRAECFHIPDTPVLAWFHIRPFEVIPTKYKPGKWRLTIDLSVPEGHSMNDFIRKK